MSLDRLRHRLGAAAAACALSLGLAGGAAAADEPADDAAAGSCPVSHAQLRNALDAAVRAVKSGLNNDMWAVVVKRDGVVCTVAFSGDTVEDQWLLSRQIAAAKAFTANGLSLDIDGSGSGPLSTAQLYPLVQPGGILFGLAEGNPLDPRAAYAGAIGRFGKPDDPMVGKRVGGTITFGGGLGLYTGGENAVGGLGLSGDTSCTDDEIARAVRKNLGKVPSAPDTVEFGSGAGKHPSCG